MSQENVEAWERAIQAFNDRDFERLVAEFAPGIEFRPLMTGMTGQPYRGREGVREWLDAIDADWETFVTTVDRIEDHDEFVLAVGRLQGRGRASGVEVTRPSAYLARFENGKVVWWQTFATREEALEAAGLSE